MLKLSLILLLIIGLAAATDYYVDFDSGSDTNDGLSEGSAWQHSPGDSNAAGAADISLQAGDRVFFKGDVVYRGTFQVQSGSVAAPIEYIGDEWGGKAIIDGTEIFNADWQVCDCAGHPLNGQIYVADIADGIGPFDGLYENDDFLWFAQDPEPSDHFFWDHFDEYNVIGINDAAVYHTRTSITDPTYFTQTDPAYWDGAYVAVWRIPNVVVTAKVTSYDPGAHTLYHEDIGGDIYTDRDTYYAVLNHIDIIDNPGEYAIDEGANKIYLYPREDISYNIYSISERGTGIKINNQHDFVIKGFVIQHTTYGINTGGNSGGTNSVIKDNQIRYLRSNGNYALQVSGDNILIEDNEVVFNQRAVGILVGGTGNTVRNNYVEKNSRQGIWFMGADNGMILNNTVVGPGGAHANGISLYMDSDNNLVAYNIIRNMNSALTYEAGDGFYFVNNAIMDGGRTNAWFDTTNVVHINNLYTGQVMSGGTTVLANNIINAGGNGEYRASNIYTDLTWDQEERYGWALTNGEVYEPDISSVYRADGTLEEGSPAIDAGIDPTQYIPDFGISFDRDLAGNIRTGLWDIGPYEYTECNPLELSTLIAIIDSWRSGSRTIQEVMQAIMQWKGC